VSFWTRKIESRLEISEDQLKSYSADVFDFLSIGQSQPPNNEDKIRYYAGLSELLNSLQNQANNLEKLALKSVNNLWIAQSLGLVFMGIIVLAQVHLFSSASQIDLNKLKVIVHLLCLIQFFISGLLLSHVYLSKRFVESLLIEMATIKTKINAILIQNQSVRAVYDSNFGTEFGSSASTKKWGFLLSGIPALFISKWIFYATLAVSISATTAFLL